MYACILSNFDTKTFALIKVDQRKILKSNSSMLPDFAHGVHPGLIKEAVLTILRPVC